MTGSGLIGHSREADGDGNVVKGYTLGLVTLSLCLPLILNFVRPRGLLIRPTARVQGRSRHAWTIRCCRPLIVQCDPLSPEPKLFDRHIRMDLIAIDYES